jgi:hypothetical protein
MFFGPSGAIRDRCRARPSATVLFWEPNLGAMGPYEIIAPLGAVGMGEVYHARDARLGRDVAINYSDLVAVTPERRASKLPGPAGTAHSAGRPIRTRICVGAQTLNTFMQCWRRIYLGAGSYLMLKNSTAFKLGHYPGVRCPLRPAGERAPEAAGLLRSKQAHIENAVAVAILESADSPA